MFLRCTNYTCSMSRDSRSKVKILIKFTKPHKINMNIDRNFKPSVKGCYSVILVCKRIGHTRSRDLGSKIKKLGIFTKAYKN